MNKRKMFFRMISASLIRRRSRMLVALLAIAIGATTLSGLVTIYYDVPRQMGAQFRNYGANMIFTPTGDKLNTEEMEEALSYIKDEDIVGAAPYRYETVRIHEQPIMAAGTYISEAEKTSPYWLVDGEWPEENGQMMVGKNVAEDLKLKVGDVVTVSYTPETSSDTQKADEEKSDEEALAEETTAAETSADEVLTEESTDDEDSDDEVLLDNYVDLTVTGILSTGGSEEDYVYFSTDDMEQLTGVNDIIDLAELSILCSSDELNSYSENINANVDSVSARLVKRVTASETTVLSKLQALVLLVTIVVLALTMICVATTMTAVVAERRREIGLRKAIGASDASIVGEFMGEGMLLGGLGGILGSILGFLFAQLVSVNVFSGSISFRPLLVPITILVSILVTGLACLLPIRSATKVDPALVLKGE